MNIPTRITVTRIVAIALLVLVLGVFQILGSQGLIHFSDIGNSGFGPVRLFTCCFFIFAAFTDFLDGYLARKWHQVTDLGKFLDPIADKLLVDLTLVFLVVPWSFESSMVINPIFVCLMIGRDFAVDGLRLLAARKNVVLAANKWGKLKTVLQMVAIPVVLLNGWPFSYFDASWTYYRIADILVYLATIVSLISGVIYIWGNRHVLKEQGNA